MNNYALVENSVVTNTILWDGVAPYTPPAGIQAVAVPTGVSVAIGDNYANGVFTASAAQTPPAPTLAQQAAALIADGLTIASIATPALNGVYTVQSGVPFGQEQIAAEAQFISTYSEFTNGATTNLSWPLAPTAEGVVTFVTFPTTAEFLAFAKVAAQFVAATTLAVGQGAALPAATASIP